MNYSFREISRPDEVTRSIEIKGRPEVIEKVTALLATLSWLGGIGASREIKFGWDGDGSERFEMETGLDHRKLVDPCRFVDDKQMCDEAKEKSGEEESMKKIDKMIESAERGADIDFLVERELKGEPVQEQEQPPGICVAALQRNGWSLDGLEDAEAPTGFPKGRVAVWSKGDKVIRLFHDGTFRAFEGGRELKNIGDMNCDDLAREQNFPDILFF